MSYYLRTDTSLRSRTNPRALDPAYASGHNLHQDPQGYEGLADAVPLRALEAGCRR